jgi:hypothetical protein
MDLKKLNVQEMSKTEMMEVEGGFWLWDAICDAGDWILNNFEITIGVGIGVRS